MNSNNNNQKTKNNNKEILEKIEKKANENLDFNYDITLMEKLKKSSLIVNKTSKNPNPNKGSTATKINNPKNIHSSDLNKNNNVNKQVNVDNNKSNNNNNVNKITTKIDLDEQINYFKHKDLVIEETDSNQKDRTYIFAMGGLEEIGKNMYVIEHNDEIVVVDVGIKFSSSDLLGVNGIIPNFDYLIKNNKKITKLIITHGHEDHIGGIPYCVKSVNIGTIHSPLLAAELIKRRLEEFKDIKTIPSIEVFSDDTVIKTKYFEIDFFRVCHSIPDCFGLFIKTPNGNLISAGDYRFDFGQDTDDTNIHKIVEMSNRGVDLFLAESTNSGQPNFSESEDDIIENINSILLDTKSRVFVATFASNLGRIEKIIERGINANRKICIMGRSMEANIKTSIKVGYLRLKDSDFISTKEILTTPDHEVLVILTGSQGEEMAALNLMAENKYSKISLKPSDTILLSSKPIPGNFKSVDVLVNKLFKLGVNVIQHSSSFKIHASGHATKQEQQMMMKLIKPNYIFPIHGESKMLISMKENAIAIGFKPEQIIIATNGQKLELFKKQITLTNKCIDTTPVLINGKKPSINTYQLVEERRKVSEDGIFMALISIDKKNRKLSKNPMITTRGCIYAKSSAALISKISYSIKDEIEELFKTNSKLTNNEISEIVKKNINSYIWKNKRKHPVVLTTIFDK